MATEEGTIEPSAQPAPAPAPEPPSEEAVAAVVDEISKEIKVITFFFQLNISFYFDFFVV